MPVFISWYENILICLRPLNFVDLNTKWVAYNLKDCAFKKWKAFKVHKHCMRGAKKACRSGNKWILNSLQKCLKISCVYIFWLLERTLKTFFLYAVAQKRLFIIGVVLSHALPTLYIGSCFWIVIYLCVANTFHVATQKGCFKAVGHLLFPAEIVFHTYFKSYLWWDNTEIFEL